MDIFKLFDCRFKLFEEVAGFGGGGALVPLGLGPSGLPLGGGGALGLTT